MCYYNKANSKIGEASCQESRGRRRSDEVSGGQPQEAPRDNVEGAMLFSVTGAVASVSWMPCAITGLCLHVELHFHTMRSRITQYRLVSAAITNRLQISGT